MPGELQHIRNQNTISDAVNVSGFGYWSGEDITLQFRPGLVNSGLCFVLNRGSESTRIPAEFFRRTDTPRRTNLQLGGARVDMVEHVLAALAGLQIDNCEIHCNANEMPGCDGSSQAFVDALSGVEVVSQDAPRRALVIGRPVKVGTHDSWIEARPLADAAYSPRTVLEYKLDYGAASPIERQNFRLELTVESFRKELARARTFVLKHEAEQLQRQGLGLRVSTADLIVFSENGPLDTTLRYPDECARHKALDMVGDFALSGLDLIGEFVAFRAGHHLNVELIKELFAVHNLSFGASRCA